MTALPEKHWVRDMFAAGDTLDPDRAMAFLSDDVVMRVCDQPITRGKPAARASFEALTQNFAAVSHTFVAIYDVAPDLTITETLTRYTLKDGRVVTNTSCNHLRHRNGLVTENKIFMDTSCFAGP
jgi:ketosteroid isomerase-like protein